MKRIFALLLAAVSLISLTACAQPEAKTVSKYQLAAPQYPQMVLVSGVHDPVLSGATNRFLSENRKPIDRIS